jgi:hypothetical protein
LSCAFAWLGRHPPVRAVVKTILPFYIRDEPVASKSQLSAVFLAFSRNLFPRISTIDKHYPVRHYGGGHFVFPSRREQM